MQWIQYVFNLKTFTLKKEVVEKRLWLYKYAHAADWLKFLLRFISNSWGGVTNQKCNSSFVLLKLSVCGAWGCFNDWNVRGCAVLCCAANASLLRKRTGCSCLTSSSYRSHLADESTWEMGCFWHESSPPTTPNHFLLPPLLTNSLLAAMVERCRASRFVPSHLAANDSTSSSFLGKLSNIWGKGLKKAKQKHNSWKG